MSELSQRSSSTAIVIVPATQRGASNDGVIDRVARWMNDRIQHSGSPASPWRERASSSVTVVESSPDDIRAIVASIECDAIVDLAGVTTDASVDAYGVSTYRLWCGETGTSVNFECLALAPMRSRHRIVWTSQDGSTPPHIAAESSVLLTSVDRAPDQVLAVRRALALLLRILEGRARGPTIGAAWTNHAQHEHSGLDTLRGSVMSRVRVWQGRLRRRWTRDDVWFLAYRVVPDGNSDAPKPAYEKWGADQSAFVADPFTLVHQGTEYVFYEDYKYAVGRGVIAWSTLQADGSLSSPRVALERPYHLSYPFVVEHDGEVYMIPETASNNSVELYRAVSFPDKWELHRTLLHGVKAVDATLHFDGCWWMFVNIGECDSSTWDELFLFKAAAIEGPWHAHPLNPVKCDPSSTRPAGRVFVRDGKLIRPAQDCSTVYGRAVTLCVIDDLTDASFAESVCGSIEPDIFPGTVALHTIARGGSLEVVDAMWAHKPRWWRGYPR